MVVLDLSRTDGPRAESAAASGVSLLGSLVIVARQHGVQLSVPQLIHDHLLEPGQPSVPQLLNIAEACGLRTSAVRLSWYQLLRLGQALPAIVLLQNGHAMVLREVSEGPEFPRVVLQDPNAHEDAPLVLDETRFAAVWTGDVLLFKRDYRLRDEDQPFGLWLIFQQFARDRRIARDIGIAAFALSILALAPILFWRVLLDSVLYYDALHTLGVLCLVMLVLISCETAFGYLRRFLILHRIAQRLDAKLSTYMFDKVIQLPVDFFERTPVGEVARDMGEMSKIRGFFTGALLGTVLDSLVLVVFLPIMFFFSPLLTFFTLGFATLICAWIILRLPELRKKTAAVFAVEGEKGSFLVETFHGVRTVKALALDRRRRHEWDVKVAKAAQLRFDEGRTANMIQTVVTPLERLMTTGVFALAVYLAVSTKETVYVGALFAFMMLSQRVAAPLVQLSQMLTQLDEARLAVTMTAKLVNQPAEEAGHGKGRHSYTDCRPRRVFRCAVPLYGLDHTGARQRLLYHSRGLGLRDHGAQWVRQDHGHPAAPIVPRQLRGPHQGRRHRPAAIRRRASARQIRRLVAGTFRVQRLDSRHDRCRQARRQPRRSGHGSALGRRRGVRRAAAGWL